MTTYSPFTCENCETFVAEGLEIHEDDLGPFIVCPVCDCSQDFDTFTHSLHGEE